MPFNIRTWLESHLPGGRITGSGWYRVKCPFHPDSSPSFAVNLSSGNYGCKAASCGVSGGLVRLVKEVEGIPWGHAFSIIDKPNPFGLYEDIPDTRASPGRPAINDFPQMLVPVSTQHFPVYLRDRQYSPEDVSPFGLWFGNSGPMRGYVVFPFWTLDGEYKTYTARRMDDDKKSKQPRYRGPEQGLASSYLYGAWLFSCLRDPPGIFAVEGPFDVMRMWTLGLPAVGLSTAASTPAQRNQLATLHQIFGVPIFIMFDTGERELESARHTAGALSCQGVPSAVIDIPDGIKDPDGMNASNASEVLDKCNKMKYSLTQRCQTHPELF